MDYAKTVEGILLIVLAALILADGVISAIEAIDMEPLLSPNFQVSRGTDQSWVS